MATHPRILLQEAQRRERLRRARQRAFARRVARWFDEGRRLAYPLPPVETASPPLPGGTTGSGER